MIDIIEGPKEKGVCIIGSTSIEGLEARKECKIGIQKETQEILLSRTNKNTGVSLWQLQEQPLLF